MNLKKVLYSLLIVAIIFALFIGVVFIASKINGVEFGQQFLNWFASKKETETEVAKEVIETATRIIA